MKEQTKDGTAGSVSRRAFLTSVSAFSLASAATVLPKAASAGQNNPHWAMLVDIRRCIGCQACTVACIQENAMPEGCFRTVVATSAVTVEGPKNQQPAGMVMLPRLCNHCETPPCTGVCPTGATFKREDGVVVVNADRCVGCSYCIQACPYDARFVNTRTNKTDKCTFCLHRITAGLLPACVETCVGGARIFGNLNDKNGELCKRIAQHKGNIGILKPEMRTKPQVFYIGLDEQFASRVQGTGSLWQPR